jgi:MFS family permease
VNAQATLHCTRYAGGLKLTQAGYDLVIVRRALGRYSTSLTTRRYHPDGTYAIPGEPNVLSRPIVAKVHVPLTRLASWQSGLSNSSVVGQLVGLFINGWTQDRFGCRPTMMFFLAWMCITIFGPVFATSLPLLAFGEAMCGVSWGVFQASGTKIPVTEGHVPPLTAPLRPFPPPMRPRSSPPSCALT